MRRDGHERHKISEMQVNNDDDDDVLPVVELADDAHAILRKTREKIARVIDRSDSITACTHARDAKIIEVSSSRSIVEELQNYLFVEIRNCRVVKLGSLAG